ncbi:flagellin [Litorivita pollutaquae]|uniref:Flagellin n=1 Tax=Litorivita pollutaquae TaxID=2200892 RepID=A0A2V4MT58_9RHOB|nr:flagellin [Litorivita pollutaquae]OUS19592.1 flagellin [Rhodobacterales bacterium 59_46_T64]PYC47378.1 flagellin [Litorivita pollutaquae]
MSSILTNNGAMVALQTLKSINSNLSDVQSQISTGKSVGSAKDNSAVWAISKVMESDVKGFKAISDSLSLGEATVSVGRKAAETVTDLLTDMKEKIVASQEDNVDKVKIQADISALRDQITTVVGAAQFNGLNLVDSAGTVNVLGSLDRDAAGNVTASNIAVTKQNLSTGSYAAKAVFDTTNTDGVSADGADTFGFALDASGGTVDAGTIEFEDPAAADAWAAGDSVTIRLGDDTVTYTITQEDVDATATEDVIAVGVKSAIEASGANVTVDYDTTTPGRVTITNADTTDGLHISGQFNNASSGGLGALAAIDVTSGASAALGSIETLIGTAIDAAAAFGSVEGRIEIQSDFVSNLSDSLKSGIGAMVDANMEEASARLTALQTQQQLGVQSLSIANSAPETLLSLFR